MGISEDVPADFYTILIPALIGVGLIVLTVFIVFWLGLRSPKSFEEAKASASRRADQVLQEKANQSSPRAKKGKKPYLARRKKKAESWEDPQEESNDTELQTPKGILKQITETVSKDGPPDRSLSNRVGFNIDTAVKEESTTPQVNPPTPYPVKTTSLFKSKEVPRTPQPLFEDEDEEETVVPTSVPPVSLKPKAPETKKPTVVTASPKAAAQKKKQKAKKEPVEVSPNDGLPVSKITEILSASSLSDDDIQQLMSTLLEQMNSNSEWESANLRSESAKVLKKQNQELQKRCEEAERTVSSHSIKVKELRSEVQNERAKHQSADNVLQGKISAQANDLVVIKTRLAGMEKENTRLKSLSSSVNSQKFEDENALLKNQIHQLTTTQQSLLATQAKQLQDLSEDNSSLKKELHRVKEALKSSSVGQPRVDRVAELESLLGNMEEEKQGLQSTMQMINDENTRLKVEATSLQSALTGLDKLKVSTNSLESANMLLMSDNSKLLEEIESLRMANDSLQTSESEEALRAQLDEKLATEVEAVRVALLGLQEVKVQELQQSISELEGQCGEKEKEVSELRSQIDTCSTLPDQLKAVSDKLAEEQTTKKLLEQELDSLKTAPTNGPSADKPGETLEATPPANEGEVTQLKEEKEELVQTVKELEKKLIDLKDKNNSLRDSLWKAKDEVATSTKAWEDKMKESSQTAEQRCKAVRKEAVAECQQVQREFLTQLFPEVSVETGEYSGWLDEFEVKVRDAQQKKDEEVSSLQCKVTELQSRVAELQENEQKSIQEAEQFRQTLQATMEILGKLQTDVQEHSTEHQQTIEEKDEMIEREKTSNRHLQDELRAEKELTSSLKQASNDNDVKLNELNTRLEDVQRHYETTQQESDSLRHSLQHELEMKEKAQEQLEQLQEQHAEIETRLVADQEDKRESGEKLIALEVEINQLREAGGNGVAQKLPPQDEAPPNPAVQTEI